MSDVPKTYRMIRGSCDLPHLIRLTRIQLKRIFGINSLSLSEGVHLRNTVKFIAESVDKQWEIFDRGNMQLESIPMPHKEAAYQFVSRTLGIDRDTLYLMTRYSGSVQGLEYLYLHRLREKAHNPGNFDY